MYSCIGTFTCINFAVTFSITGGANNFEIFSLGGKFYMVDANLGGSNSIRTWNGASFVNATTIGVPFLTYNWKFVDTGSSQFIAQATTDSYANSIYRVTAGPSFVIV